MEGIVSKGLEVSVGMVFDMLEVIGLAEPSATGSRRWVCKCECGNLSTVLESNLKRGHTTSCGCKKERNLKGLHIGKLEVLERSDKRGSRGKRSVPLWKCRCDCGNITYKATDTLTNPDISMCQECSTLLGLEAARANAGYCDGTQISKIKVQSHDADNLSGVRGVYFEPKTGHYRARLKFKGKLYNFGSFANVDDALKARKEGEEKIFGAYLESIGLEGR